MSSAIAPIDQSKFRDVLGHFPTGVVLITGAAQDGSPVGMIVGSFTSVSLDPPIVAFLPARDSSTWQKLRGATTFCVNVLAADQTELCRHFARKGDHDKFAEVRWDKTPAGDPILDGVVASIDCEVDSIVAAGDHDIVLGTVRGLEVHNPTMPLVFFQGGFGRFTSHSLLAESDAELIVAARRAQVVSEDLQSLAGEVGAKCTLMTTKGSDVVVLAAATARGQEASDDLGARTPFMPPLGELFVAYAPVPEVDAWLARATPIDSVSSETYRARLSRSKNRGWSLALAGPYRERELTEAIREYNGVDLTPAQQRHLSEVVASVSADHEVPEIADGLTYDISGIVAPIFGRDGRVQQVIRISQLAPGADAPTVRGWISALTAAAERITERLNGRADRA